MMQRMDLTRVIAAGVLLAAAGAFVAVPACIVAVDQNNGGDCVKNFDCESQLCVAGKCVAQNGDFCQTDQGCASNHCVNGRCQPLPFDSAPPEDASDAPPEDTSSDGSDAGDDAPKETATDTTPPADTTPPPDTTPADSGIDLGLDVPE